VSRSVQSHPFLRRLDFSDTVNLTGSSVAIRTIWGLASRFATFFFKKLAGSSS
jgi:hypothetical protein